MWFTSMYPQIYMIFFSHDTYTVKNNVPKEQQQLLEQNYENNY